MSPPLAALTCGSRPSRSNLCPLFAAALHRDAPRPLVDPAGYTAHRPKLKTNGHLTSEMKGRHGDRPGDVPELPPPRGSNLSPVPPPGKSIKAPSFTKDYIDMLRSHSCRFLRAVLPCPTGHLGPLRYYVKTSVVWTVSKQMLAINSCDISRHEPTHFNPNKLIIFVSRSSKG